MKEELLSKMKQETTARYEKIKQLECKNKKTIEDVFYKVFNDHIYQINKDDTNKLFVKKGSYIKGYDDPILGPQDTPTLNSDTRIDYVAYHDLEQFFEIDVPIKEYFEFEKENNILEVSPDKYYNTRKEFITDVFHFGQTQAKQNMIKKYIRKK